MYKQAMLKVLFFSFALGLLNTQCEAEPVTQVSDFRDDFFSEDNWGFIGRKFYDEPKDEYQRWYKKFLRFIALTGGTVGSGFAAGYGVKKLVDAKQAPDWMANHSKKSIAAASVGAAGTFIAFYCLVNAQLKKSTDRRALRKFIENWDHNKEYTPSGLQAVFTKIHALYIQKGWQAINGDATMIIKEVRQQLIRQDKNYAKLYETDKDYFNGKYFRVAVTLDLVGIFQTAWMVCRDCVKIGGANILKIIPFL
jgi:hypothetical protein